MKISKVRKITKIKKQNQTNLRKKRKIIPGKTHFQKGEAVVEGQEGKRRYEN